MYTLGQNDKLTMFVLYAGHNSSRSSHYMKNQTHTGQVVLKGCMYGMAKGLFITYYEIVSGGAVNVPAAKKQKQNLEEGLLP